ncbi:MAG: YbaB/EbfC family nucleoid-associated protein [Fimbriiglobus sp.]
MFGQLGAMMNLLGNKAKLQEEMAKFQEKIGHLSAEGTAGGGLVAVKVNGRMEVVACRLGENALKLERGLLEDLIAAATNQALASVREQLAAETAKMAAGMGLPPGMLNGIPGLG